jgi:hypothetical protein
VPNTRDGLIRLAYRGWREGRLRRAKEIFSESVRPSRVHLSIMSGLFAGWGRIEPDRRQRSCGNSPFPGSCGHPSNSTGIGSARSQDSTPDGETAARPPDGWRAKLRRLDTLPISPLFCIVADIRTVASVAHRSLPTVREVLARQVLNVR